MSDISEDQPSIDSEVPHGYKLKSVLQDQTLPEDDTNAADLTNAAFFPWHKQSLQTLWGGKRITTWPGTTNRERTRVPMGTLPIEEAPITAEEVWLKIVRRWMGCAAICAGNELRLVQTRDNVLAVIRRLKVPEDNIQTVTWALDFDTLHPLVVFAGDKAMIRIVDVETWERIGVAKGHGGPITHLTTHPIRPNYILSTSRDWTARMWSLADPVDTTAAPAYWPGQLSVAGQTARNAKNARNARKAGNAQKAGELDLSQLSLKEARASDTPSDALISHTGPAGSAPEGDKAKFGKGVCIAVFKGAAAGLGGHQSWVLCADFHPTKPFVITGGADRAVKIWRVPDFPTPETQRSVGIDFSVVELPLFSSTHLHEGAVEYVKWATRDMIISKSKTMTTQENDFAATVLLWRWLDLKRFAPNELEPKENEVRPSYHDYTESRSYANISDLSLPQESVNSTAEWRLDVCPTWPDLVLASETDTVHIIDMHEHMCTPEILAARKRELEDKGQRKERKRDIFHPVDIVDVPHQMVRIRGRDREGEFQILRAMMNPLDPRVLLGIGKNGIAALWVEDGDEGSALF